MVSWKFYSYNKTYSKIGRTTNKIRLMSFQNSMKAFIFQHFLWYRAFLFDNLEMFLTKDISNFLPLLNDNVMYKYLSYIYDIPTTYILKSDWKKMKISSSDWPCPIVLSRFFKVERSGSLKNLQICQKNWQKKKKSFIQLAFKPFYP